MTTLSVADGSYTNLLYFFHHFIVARVGFEPTPYDLYLTIGTYVVFKRVVSPHCSV